MTEHTPGPWKVGYRAMDVLADYARPKGPMKVCDIRGWGFLTGKGQGALGLSFEEAVAIQEANAALIAAAPKLLDALEQLIDDMQDGHSVCEQAKQEAIAAVAEARAKKSAAAADCPT